jgi:hypothetical protein
MVLDFAKEAIEHCEKTGSESVEDTLLFLNALLVDKRREAKTVENAIVYLENYKKRKDKE